MTLSIPPWDSEAPTRVRAPTQAAWDAMSEPERAAVVASLPSWVDIEESGAMQGDKHRTANQRAERTLTSHFAAADPEMYITAEMGTYFPGEERVVPDLMAVPGGGAGQRLTWVVTREAKRPAWVLEILVAGHREKDLRDHVVRYAELGIREYFIADLIQRRILAYRLPDPSIAIYTPVLAQHGRYRAEVLGLDVVLEDGAVRFYEGARRLLDPDEQVEALRDALNDELVLRQDAEARANDEARARGGADQARREAEQRAADEARARGDADQARREAEQRAADEARARYDADQARREAEQRAADAVTELTRMRELIERLQRG